MGLSGLKLNCLNMVLLNDDNIYYDLSYLNEMDDEQYVKEVIRLFLESTPGLLNDISNAADLEDWNSVYQKAHKLKSSVGLLKMDVLFKCLSEIESRAKAQTDMASIKALLESAKSTYESDPTSKIPLAPNINP